MFDINKNQSILACIVTFMKNLQIFSKLLFRLVKRIHSNPSMPGGNKKVTHT